MTLRVSRCRGLRGEAIENPGLADRFRRNAHSAIVVLLIVVSLVRFRRLWQPPVAALYRRLLFTTYG